MSIDMHAHAFHPKIAAKVISQLENHYGLRAFGTGLLADLKEREVQAGIQRVALLSAATSPDQVPVVNTWAINHRADPLLEPFGSLHPEYLDWENELYRLENAGIRGLKFHPHFQNFDVDDARLGPMWETIGERFLLVFHVGERRGTKRHASSPAQMRWLHKNFSYLRLVAAHLGGVFQWAEAIEFLMGEDIFLDTSSCISMIPDQELRILLKCHPRERLLFGSDYPLFDPGLEIRLWQERACVTDAWIEGILQNGETLLESIVSLQ